MKAAEFIADFLADKGVTDVFGIPGGVVLELLYAFESNEKITPHLSYHEQCAAFEAGGYAQASGRVGVAYATKGPGVMNMVTAVADAYCDSIALLIFTAHEGSVNCGKIRVMDDQEFNLESIFSTITKLVLRIDNIYDVKSGIAKAYKTAVSGRRGPVLVDFASSVFSLQVQSSLSENVEENNSHKVNVNPIVTDIGEAVCKSKRPVILAGEGIKMAGMIQEIKSFAENNGIPVLSSRYSEDLMPFSHMYYGYIGTHATRYSNFILSKSDLIIGLGNRMSFPVQSESFGRLVQNKKIIRVDIDHNELERKIPGTKNYIVDLRVLMPELSRNIFLYKGTKKWIAVCDLLKRELENYDTGNVVRSIVQILQGLDKEIVLTSDVGNHELYLSRAYISAKIRNKILYSKSFGALGCSIGKAIGAYYALKKPVVSFVGDQGFQMNVQELQLVSYGHLPIVIVVLNNNASGMIRNRERGRYGEKYLHTTPQSGYGIPDVKGIANSYGIKMFSYHELSANEKREMFLKICEPLVIEVVFDDEKFLFPSLRKGEPCQDLYPYLDRESYRRLEDL